MWATWFDVREDSTELRRLSKSTHLVLAHGNLSIYRLTELAQSLKPALTA